MQLFSRKKALVAASLSALVALGACGDNVTVPVAPPAPVLISITPPSANINVGESVSFAVQISGGSTTAVPTLASCTSSAPAVATAAVNGSACRVTAVAAGNATVTAAASTGQIAAASVAVSAPTPAISSLAVSPSAAQLAVGQNVTLVPTVQPAGRTVAYTYTSSSATIATVSAAGVVSAVAPGVATITVTANGSFAGFANSTISQAVTITVSNRVPGITSLTVQPSSVQLALGGTQALTSSVAGPRNTSATLTYGTSAPAVATVSATGVITAVSAGTAVITVTAQSAESGAFDATSITALVPVTVSPNAQVAIVNLTRGGSTIDISNVTDQIEVNLAIQPNGQVVSEANVWVCDPAETVPACAARTNGVPAARQSFTASGTQATNVQLYINTSEFSTPDFVSGADANTLYKNGLRTIVATLTTSPNTGSTIASNTISQVNFNNPDGWTISWMSPLNRANDPSNITWYGGPSTPDVLTPSAQSGTGSFTVVPVVYTPGRTVAQAVLNLSSSCGSNITDRTRPFAGTYGTMTRDTLAVNFNCTGTATSTSGLTPQVVGAVDNNNNGYLGTTATPAVARSIFDDFSNIANSTTGGFRQSLAYRRNYLYLPHDYAAPTITAFDVRGGTDGTATYQDSAWVNAAYFLVGTNPLTATSAGSFRYRISDGNVGLTSTNGNEFGAGAAARNTLFSLCAQSGIPATIASSPTAINCTSPVATGGISSTIGTLGAPENPTNFTNTAYFAQAAETDRLGNRATSIVYSTTGTGSVTRTPGLNTAATGPAVFGIDLTNPAVAVIPNTGAGSIANAVRSDVDSIFTNNGAINAPGQTLASAALFAVRFTDNRSGFPICVVAVGASGGTCPAAAAGTDVNAGTFSVTRVSAPTLATVTNDAVVEGIVRTANTSATAADRRLNVLNSVVSGFDPAYREFTFNIFGAANRVASTVTLTGGTPAASVAGYYTFAGTITDRAGNSSTLPSKSVAIDNADPQVTGIQIPAVLTGGTTVAFGPTGTDDLEAVSGDLALRYPQLSYDDGVGAAVVGLPNTIRFRRVPHYSTTAALGLWHNPFAAVTDSKLTTPIGPGTSLGSTGLAVPIPFIQQIATVTVAAAPPTPTQIFGLFPGAADPRPNQVSAWLYDIRATSNLAFTGNGRSAILSQPIFGGQIPTPSAIATTKDWGTATASGAGITAWQIFTAAGVSEFRATTSTSITNPPFTSVQIVRQVGATEWEYIGTATYAGPLDQGANRFWRYTITSSAIGQGNGVTMAALANGDQIKAIGVDAAGNGLSTATQTNGAPLAIQAGSTFGPFAVAAVAQGGAVQNIALSIGGTGPAVGANLVYSCSSNNALVTAVIDGVIPTQCNIDDAGVAGAAANVTITFTVTGSGAGLSGTTLTSTTIVVRNP